MQMIREEQFNKWFSVFILLGMTVATCVVTAIKLGAAPEGHFWLLLAALGSLMGVAATVCSANGLIITFLFGLLDVAIYGAMCWLNWRRGAPGLGNALLHFAYFVPMQFVGYFQWKKRGASPGGEKVRARRLSAAQRWILTGAALAATVVAYLILARFDRSAATSFIKVAVVLDVVPLVCNILGQLLMSTAYMEQWILWICVNVFSIAMWAHTLHTTPDSTYALVYMVKYSFYLVNALNGLRIWLRLSRQ